MWNRLSLEGIPNKGWIRLAVNPPGLDRAVTGP